MISKILKEAKELAQYDMPATMTYKKAAETYCLKKKYLLRMKINLYMVNAQKKLLRNRNCNKRNA